jgi:hypothetical protein
MVLRHVPVTEHLVAVAKDPVMVAPLSDGGLISYRKPDGAYIHTLNSREGFERKLQQLGITQAGLLAALNVKPSR